MARRAESSDRMGEESGMARMIERLTETLERTLANQQPAAPIIQYREVFKAPEYDGTGNVDYFVRQFNEVATANAWTAEARLIHLRAALRDAAKDCGQADTLPGVFASLQARFGISTREAKARLVSLKRDSKTTLQAHAAEVERLVNLAYADLPREPQIRMTMDIFHSSINNGYLQRHLLAVNAATLEEAVRAGNEFLQIKTGTAAGPSIRQVAGEESDDVSEESNQVNQVTPSTMDVLLQAVKQLTQEVASLKSAQQKPVEKKGKTAKCFGCGKEGHIRHHRSGDGDAGRIAAPDLGEDLVLGQPARRGPLVHAIDQPVEGLLSAHGHEDHSTFP